MTFWCWSQGIFLLSEKRLSERANPKTSRLHTWSGNPRGFVNGKTCSVRKRGMKRAHHGSALLNSAHIVPLYFTTSGGIKGSWCILEHIAFTVVLSWALHKTFNPSITTPWVDCTIAAMGACCTRRVSAPRRRAVYMNWFPMTWNHNPQNDGSTWSCTGKKPKILPPRIYQLISKHIERQIRPPSSADSMLTLSTCRHLSSGHLDFNIYKNATQELLLGMLLSRILTSVMLRRILPKSEEAQRGNRSWISRGGSRCKSAGGQAWNWRHARALPIIKDLIWSQFSIGNRNRWTSTSNHHGLLSWQIQRGMVLPGTVSKISLAKHPVNPLIPDSGTRSMLSKTTWT